MVWKIISIILPQNDRDILNHLASLPHSWTVDHEHSNCQNEPLICHAASHEYGASGQSDGKNQHQHFVD